MENPVEFPRYHCIGFGKFSFECMLENMMFIVDKQNKNKKGTKRMIHKINP